MAPANYGLRKKTNPEWPDNSDFKVPVEAIKRRTCPAGDDWAAERNRKWPGYVWSLAGRRGYLAYDSGTTAHDEGVSGLSSICHFSRSPSSRGRFFRNSESLIVLLQDIRAIIHSNNAQPACLRKESQLIGISFAYRGSDFVFRSLHKVPVRTLKGAPPDED